MSLLISIKLEFCLHKKLWSRVPVIQIFSPVIQIATLKKIDNKMVLCQGDCLENFIICAWIFPTCSDDMRCNGPAVPYTGEKSKDEVDLDAFDSRPGIRREPSTKRVRRGGTLEPYYRQVCMWWRSSHSKSCCWRSRVQMHNLSDGHLLSQ